MTLEVVFRRAASAEFTAAAAWYERQRAGLGGEFIDEVERCVALAAERPELYAAVHHTTRRITTLRFPYSVYFRAEAHRSSSWQFSTQGGIRSFGKIGPDEQTWLALTNPQEHRA